MVSMCISLLTLLFRLAPTVTNVQHSILPHVYQQVESGGHNPHRPPANRQHQHPGGSEALMRTYDAPGAALAERAHALRAYCMSALGQQLFDLIYGALRRVSCIPHFLPPL